VSLPTVATPAINPNGGSYTGSVFVAMQTATAGASIYYTTDGSTPTQSSALYTGAMTLTSSAVVKAKAFKSGSNASMEASASFNVTPTDLVAHWKFDEVSGTNASDSSGNGNTGTLVNGPIWTAGKIASALSFDGVDDYVSFASQAQSTISISAWVYAQATPGNLFPRIIDMPGYVLLLAESGAPDSNSMSLGFRSRRSSQDGRWDTPANSMAYNSWHHVALVYDSPSTLNNPDLYINGVKQTISTITSPQGTQTANGGTGIIGNRIPLDRGWQGIIDDLRVYNRALSATEIQTLYQQAAPSQTVTPVIPSVTPAKLTLSWGDTSSNEDNFQLERKTGANGTYVQIALVSANVTSYVDGNLIGGTTYCYRVAALNGAGMSSYSNEACDTAP
jgi:hypothetical protein